MPKQMKKLLFALVSIFAAAQVSTVQIDSCFLNYQAQISKLLVDNKVPAVGIGMIRDGRLRQVHVYGELTKGNPAPFNTIFNVASLTKPVTAMLTLKLVSMGNWHL